MFKVFTKAEEQKDTYLRLDQDGDRVVLNALNDRGQILSSILAIQTDGTVRMFSHVSNKLGLYLNDNGQVVSRY
jgi:hypothetical protein